MHHITLRAVGIGLLALAAHGCTKLTTIGWSSETDAALSGARHATEIRAKRNALLQPNVPALGDIDGDGFDDFILVSSPLTSSTDAPQTSASTAYLFYGRPGFPEQLQVQDADASFETGAAFNNPLGDVNGDGYNDFALGDLAGIELIFGGPERLTGHHEKLTTGKVVWTYEPKQLTSAGLTTQIDRAWTLGDTNGDGYDDIALRVIEEAPDDKNVFGAVGVVLNDFVILGRRDNWPSGAWDPSWAVASFGKDSGESVDQYSKLCIVGSGDFDGDGLTDISAEGWDREWLFYGKPQGFQGTLSPDNADAELHFGKNGYPFVIGDLDADGADDLALPWLNDMRIFYGKAQRWSGRVEPEAELTFYDQGSYHSAVVGDYNSDGHPDLLFVGGAETMHWDDWSVFPQEFDQVLYQVKGTGQRLTGRVQLTSADVYAPIGYAAPAVLDAAGFTIQVGGDLDGEGSSDLIVSAPGQQDPADTHVLLLPGAARAPD